jgi:protein ImuB
VLWIALHLPLLSLEAFEATLAAHDAHAAERPLALMDAQRIVAANAAAHALGVKPGLKRATALALAPQLVLGRADRERDGRALEPVAHAALAFTPTVVVPPAEAADAAPHTVLLEVASSLRFFGGRAKLLHGLEAALAPLGHRVHVALAPTAQGAALLAHAQPRTHCPDPATLAVALDTVPVWLLGPGREHWNALQGMGLRTIGDLRSLPRTGLARRFGDALLLELDRAFGLEPDPRTPIALPPAFESRLELFARADSAEQLLHGAGVLLDRLVLWLGAQHAFLRRCTLEMQHETRWRARSDTPRTTCLELALAAPSRDRAHLIALLRERLDRLVLPAPTLDLVLRADDVVQRAAPNNELFGTAQGAHEGLVQLIERLQARLGPEHVQRLEPVQDHRPEQASCVVSAAAVEDASARATLVGLPAGKAARKAPAMPPRRSKKAAAAATAPAAVNPQKRRAPGPPPLRTPTPRPVWMLPQPQPLSERHDRPLLDGEPLHLVSGPERIEAGWWDTALAERDYFIAQAADGALVWIYRARLPLSVAEDAQGWFMQGRFG